MNNRLGPNSLMVEFVDMERVLGDIEQLTRDHDETLWRMGDIVDRVFRAVHGSDYMRREFARQGVSMAALARQMGVTPSRLKALRLAASTFAPKDRNPDLSWEHHHVVARHLVGDTPAARRRWLKDAAKHGWSARALSRRLAARLPRAPVEERVERLRRRLAKAEQELAHRRQGRTRGKK